MTQPKIQKASKLRYLNAVRWVVLSWVFFILLLLPVFSVYQNFAAAHAYDLLPAADKRLYDIVEFAVSIFSHDSVSALNHVKGSTWSATIFGFQISDPLAWLSASSASQSWLKPLLLATLVPVVISLLFGRFFCGWICPASFLFELNSNLRAWLQRRGFKMLKLRGYKYLNLVVLGVGCLVSMLLGAGVFALIYPPAIVARELFYVIALGSFSLGALLMLVILLSDLFLSRRGFCRYVCPGGALYSYLGYFRLLRVQRKVSVCNNCAVCNAVCEFGLEPMSDKFGPACNNCTACISSCPTMALTLAINYRDQPYQGVGHQGRPAAQLIERVLVD